MVLCRVLLLLIPILAPLILEGGKHHHYLLTDKLALDEVACLHKQPRIDTPSTGAIPYNTHCIEVLRCTTRKDHQEWCKVKYFKKRGWIPLTQASDDPGCTVDPDSSLTEKVLTLARSKLGAPYRYGKTGPDSFDCSGFVYHVFKRAKIPLPRTSILQSQTGPKLTREELRPGDLLFFDTFNRGRIVHTGIYLGEGRFIHATSGSAFRVTISDLDHGFYKDKFRWGVRKIQTPDTNTTSKPPKAKPGEHGATTPPPPLPQAAPAARTTSDPKGHITDRGKPRRTSKQSHTKQPSQTKKHPRPKQRLKPVKLPRKPRTKTATSKKHTKPRAKTHSSTHSKSRHIKRKKKMTLQEFGKQLKKSLQRTFQKRQ